MSPFLAGLRWRPDRVRRSSHLRACCVRPASISRCTRIPLADADVIFPKADMYVISMNPCSAAGTATAPSPRSVRRAWRPPCRSTVRRVPPGARPPRCVPRLRPGPRLPGRIAPALLLPGQYVQTDTARADSPLGPSPPGRLRPADSARPTPPGRLGPGGSTWADCAPGPYVQVDSPGAQAGPPLSPAHSAGI
jgi:hypothetical protein